MEHIQPMKGLIRHLLDNAADHDALIKILWDTLDLCVVTPRLSTDCSTLLLSNGLPGPDGPLGPLPLCGKGPGHDPAPQQG